MPLVAFYCDYVGETDILQGFYGVLDSLVVFCFMEGVLIWIFQKKFLEIFLTPGKYFTTFFGLKIYFGIFPASEFFFIER